MSNYDTAQLWRVVSEKGRRKARRQMRWILAQRQLRHLLQVARRPFCQHGHLVMRYLRDHPDYYWIIGHTCASCGRYFPVEPREQVMEPQKPWRP